MNGMDRSEMSNKIKQYDQIQAEISNLEDFLKACTGQCADISIRLGGNKPLYLMHDPCILELAEKLHPVVASMIYEREKKRDNL